jgi:hypothetical protein
MSAALRAHHWPRISRSTGLKKRGPYGRVVLASTPALTEVLSFGSLGTSRADYLGTSAGEGTSASAASSKDA